MYIVISLLQVLGNEIQNNGISMIKKKTFINIKTHMKTVVQKELTSQPQLGQETQSIDEQIQSCKRLVELVINKNYKLEKKIKEMEANFTILCIAITAFLSVCLYLSYM